MDSSVAHKHFWIEILVKFFEKKVEKEFLFPIEYIKFL